MDTLPPDINNSVHLEQIMLRGDTWRGQVPKMTDASGCNTGYPALNLALVTGGWPTKALIEVCQQGFTQQEWYLFTPALRDSDGLIVLLNPPLVPFAQGLIISGVDMERVRIVRPSRVEDFISSFVELCRTPACGMLLAWQMDQRLTYTDLRKCLLAAQEGEGLYTLFRPATAQQESSPASLRLLVGAQADGIGVNIFKQRGMLQGDKLVKLPLPPSTEAILPYHLLDLYDVDGTDLRPKPKAPVFSIRGRK
jgi:protein ImuA